MMNRAAVLGGARQLIFRYQKVTPRQQTDEAVSAICDCRIGSFMSLLVIDKQFAGGLCSGENIQPAVAVEISNPEQICGVAVRN
jgi:hypothetical protein